VFKIKDKTNREIRLTKERWSHINEEHPEIAQHIEDIKETLKTPFKIISYNDDENVKYYYKYLKNRKPTAKYLLLIVKYLNGEGFIITAYFVKNIK